MDNLLRNNKEKGYQLEKENQDLQTKIENKRTETESKRKKDNVYTMKELELLKKCILILKS